MQEKKIRKITAKEMGLRLRQIRESRGLTQDALAKRCELTSQAVNQIEQGRRKPSFDTLVSLAQGIRISLDSLVGLPTPGNPMHISNPTILALAEKIAHMPAAIQSEVKDFCDFVWDKRVRNQAKSG